MTPVQETISPVIESTYQVQVSTGQALGMSVSEPIAIIFPNRDTLPATANTPVGQVLVSQAMDIPTFLPASSSPSLASPCSPTTEAASPSNEVCQNFCFSNSITIWLHFLHFLVFQRPVLLGYA